MSRFPRHPACAGARPRPGRSSPGPYGPAGAPPGQDLRSGSYMAANEAGHTNKISSIRVSTLSGEPRPFNIVFRAVATLFGPARLCDGEIEVGIGVGFVFEGVVPPFAVVGVEAAVLHDGAEVVPVFRFGRCDSSCSVMG